jgi:putative membrane protein
MRVAFVSSALTLLALAPAVAQSTDRPPMPRPHVGAAPQQQSPGMTDRHRANVPDHVFLTQATLGGRAEIDLAQLAEQKARNESVREFARRMIRDHTQTNDALNRLSEGEEMPAPNQLDAERRQVRDALSALTGAAFDIEYLRVQVQAHQRMAQLMAYEIGSGADAQVQRVATVALPRVLMHLAIARHLLYQVSIQNPQIAAEPPRKVSGMPTPQTPRASLN